MPFTAGALHQALLHEALEVNNGQLITQEIVLDPTHNLPITPVFWSTGSIVAAVLNCSPKQVTTILCVGAHQGKRFGVTIEQIPKAVIISHDDLVGSNALFSKNANSVANRDKDYVRTVLQTQRHMMKVVPVRADQFHLFFDTDDNPGSVRDTAKLFEGRKTAKDTLVRNWLRAALVAKDLDNNADSTSQLQIEPELPATFSAEQSPTFYTDLKVGFDEDDHTVGTAVADGILNSLHPSFIPEPPPEVIDVDDDRNVRQRTATPETPTDALLQRVIQLEASLTEQRRQSLLAEGLAEQQRQYRDLQLQNNTARNAAASALRSSLRSTVPPLPAPRGWDRVVSEYERRAEDSIEKYNHIAITRPLSTQERTHLQHLLHKFPEAAEEVHRRNGGSTNTTFRDMGSTTFEAPVYHPTSTVNTPFRGNGFSTGSTSQFAPPAGTTTTNANPFGDTAYGTSGLTGPFGNTAFNLGTPAPAPPPQMDIAQRLQDLQGKAIAGHLTTEEMNAFNVLNSGMVGSGSASSPITAVDSANTIGTRGFNVCGWAHLQPSELHHLHECNDSGWLRFTNAKNKEDRKAIVDAYFVQPLVKKNGRFRQILTTEFRDLILNWRLAPTNFEGSKPHGGLGPLSFVTRSLAEQENIEYYRTLNSLTANPTTADFERAVPGTPKIPDNIDALITLLVLNQLALVQVIGNLAPPPVAIQRLIDALYDNYNRLTGISDFQMLISNELVYQLCSHLGKYFSTYCTEADVMEKRFPKFNIDFLINGIENNNLAMSMRYGPIFATKKNTQRQTPSTPGGGGGGGGTTGGNTGTTTPASRKRAADRKAATAAATLPQTRSGPGCEAIRKLVEEHRAKNDGKFPRLSDIRTANDFTSSKEMCTEIGLNASKCIMWGLYCSCKGRCRTPHQTDFTSFKPERALAIMLKATKA